MYPPPNPGWVDAAFQEGADAARRGIGIMSNPHKTDKTDLSAEATAARKWVDGWCSNRKSFSDTPNAG